MFGISVTTIKDLGLIGAVATVVSAVITGLISIYFKSRADRQIEMLKAELGYDSKIKSARIDYEYEARKRLYKEVEPILFAAQLAAKSLGGRLASFTHRIRDGYITLDKRTNWLTIDQYFQQSTAYWIFLPMTYYRHISRNISQFDISLDPVIGKKFMVLGIFQSIPVADFILAQMECATIPYDPYNKDANNKVRNADPAQYRFQGIVRGDVERIVSMMMTDDERLAPLEWFMFERQLGTANSDLHEAYKPVKDILANFHPMTHPVVWRAMIAYVLLCDFFTKAQEFSLDEFDALAPQSDWMRFDYRATDREINEAVPRGHYEAARTYVRDRLEEKLRMFE